MAKGTIPGVCILTVFRSPSQIPRPWEMCPTSADKLFVYRMERGAKVETMVAARHTLPHKGQIHNCIEF